MENLPAVKNDLPLASKDLYMDENNFAQIQRAAKMFASSDMVPKAFQNKVGNCVIALEMAHRLGALPLEIMQNLYVVHGTPSFSGKFIHAMFNRSNEWERLNLEYEYQGGQVVACTASSTHIPTGKKQSFTLTWNEVQAEGWDKPKGSMKSKWVTMKQMMFGYRTASIFVKLFAPELLLGMSSVEEIIDAGEAIDVTAEVNSVDDAPSFVKPTVSKVDEQLPPEEVIETDQADPDAGKSLADMPPIDGNWWEVKEHWKFRKGFDFLMAVMAGFMAPYPDKPIAVVIDGKEYMLDKSGADSYEAFLEKNQNAVGTLSKAAEEYVLAVRKKFVFNLKIAPEIWEILQSGKGLGDPLFF